MGGRGLGLWGAASRPCGRVLELSIKRQQYHGFNSTQDISPPDISPPDESPLPPSAFAKQSFFH